MGMGYVVILASRPRRLRVPQTHDHFSSNINNPFPTHTGMGDKA
jgi:hypothetical protein